MFSLPTIGTVGLTEEQAAGYSLSIYASRFRALKLTLVIHPSSAEEFITVRTPISA